MYEFCVKIIQHKGEESMKRMKKLLAVWMSCMALLLTACGAGETGSSREESSVPDPAIIWTSTADYASTTAAAATTEATTTTVTTMTAETTTKAPAAAQSPAAQRTTTTKRPTTTRAKTETTITTTTVREQESQTVYVTPTGKRYHLLSTCGGKNSAPIRLEDALSRGYTPCQKCAS